MFYLNVIGTNAANHEIRGEWCSCGETAQDCFIQLLVRASHKWKEEAYERLFREEQP